MVKTLVNHTQRGTPYEVGVHVDRHSGGDDDPFRTEEGTECSEQALSCLGVPFSNGEEA